MLSADREGLSVGDKRRGGGWQGRGRFRPAEGLAGNEPSFKLGVYLLVDKYEAQHGPAHAPLIAALLKENHLKQCVQQPWQ